jgi:hypothetical protein
LSGKNHFDEGARWDAVNDVSDCLFGYAYFVVLRIWGGWWLFEACGWIELDIEGIVFMFPDTREGRGCRLG